MSARHKKTPEPPPVVKNVQAIAEFQRRMLEERTHINRLSDVIMRAAASPPFIVLHLVIFAGWIVINNSRYTFDPPPFNLLNLILTLEAIILTSIVLISQNDLRRMSDRRAHLDLQVNILAEQELTAILKLLNQICKRLDIDIESTEPDVKVLAKQTNLETIATALENTLEEQPIEKD